jgi:hypothetical protein
MTKYYKEQL